MTNLFNNPVIDYFGNKRWYNTKSEYHRIEGPAVIWADGYEEYIVNNKHHRIGGPAIIRSNGTKTYCVDGNHVTKEEHDLLYDIMKLKGLI